MMSQENSTNVPYPMKTSCPSKIDEPMKSRELALKIACLSIFYFKASIGANSFCNALTFSWILDEEESWSSEYNP